MRLRAEVEEVRPVGRGVPQLAHEVVDRRPVREVGEVDLEPVAQVPDVVEGAARGRADERVHGRSELDERVRQVRAHEAVGACDENRSSLVDVSELGAEVVEHGACPESVVRHGPYASASVSKRTDSSGLGSLGSAALTATSLLVVSGFAALVGVIIAREFGYDGRDRRFLRRVRGLRGRRDGVTGHSRRGAPVACTLARGREARRSGGGIRSRTGHRRRAAPRRRTVRRRPLGGRAHRGRVGGRA